MKVKCIDNSAFEDQLTNEKDYIVLEFHSWDSAKIINDNGDTKYYGLEKFVWSEGVYE